MISVHAVELNSEEKERLRKLPEPLFKWENAVANMAELKQIADDKELDMKGRKGYLAWLFRVSAIASVIIVLSGFSDDGLSEVAQVIWLLFLGVSVFLGVRSLYKDRIRSLILRAIIGYFLIMGLAGIGSMIGVIAATAVMTSSPLKVFPIIATVITGLIINSRRMKKKGAYNKAKADLQIAERNEQAAWDELDKLALVLLPEGYRTSKAAATAYERIMNGRRTINDALEL